MPSCGALAFSSPASLLVVCLPCRRECLSCGRMLALQRKRMTVRQANRGGVSRSVVAGVWGSSQTRVWVALPVSRKLPGTRRRLPRAARRPTRGHVLPLVDQDGGLKPGQSLWAGPQGARRAWWADPRAVLRMVRSAARRARTRQPEDRLVLPKRVFGWVESAALVPVKLWLRRPIETARSSAITRVRLAGPPRRSS